MSSAEAGLDAHGAQGAGGAPDQRLLPDCEHPAPLTESEESDDLMLRYRYCPNIDTMTLIFIIF